MKSSRIIKIINITIILLHVLSLARCKTRYEPNRIKMTYVIVNTFASDSVIKRG